MKITIRTIKLLASILLFIGILMSPRIAWAGSAFQTVPTARPPKTAVPTSAPASPTTKPPKNNPQPTSKPEQSTQAPVYKVSPTPSITPMTSSPTVDLSSPALTSTPEIDRPTTTPVFTQEAADQSISNTNQAQAPVATESKPTSAGTLPSKNATGSLQCLTGNMLVILFIVLCGLFGRIWIVRS